MKRFSLILCLVVFIFAGCTGDGNGTTVPQTTQVTQIAMYTKITAEQAKVFIDAGGVTILDVRTQEEFDTGHIENAVLIPDTEIANLAARLLPDKNAKILIYCRSGRRSALAANELIGMGYTDVLDFGGIIDWPYDTVK